MKLVQCSCFIQARIYCAVMHDIKLAVDLGKVDGFFVSRKLSLPLIISCFIYKFSRARLWARKIILLPFCAVKVNQKNSNYNLSLQ